MANYPRVPLENSVQYTLDSQIAQGGNTITLNQSVAGVVQAPGRCVIDRVDSAGNKTATKREFKYFTGVSGATLTGVTNDDGNDQVHGVGAIVEFVPTVGDEEDKHTVFANEHNEDGTHKASAGVSAGVDGWIDVTDSWSYSSADDPTFVITVPSGAAAIYGVGDRIKLTQTTVKYFIITAVADTALTVYGGTDYDLANAAISDISYSHQKSPLGFPLSPTKWSVIVTDANTRSQSTPTASTWYNLGSLTISIPIGTWGVSYQTTFRVRNSSATTELIGSVTLSTANNSESDSDLTSHMGSEAASGNKGSQVRMVANKNISVASKTPYYLNGQTGNTATSIDFLGGGVYGKTLLSAVCAYL